MTAVRAWRWAWLLVPLTVHAIVLAVATRPWVETVASRDGGAPTPLAHVFIGLAVGQMAVFGLVRTLVHPVAGASKTQRSLAAAVMALLLIGLYAQSGILIWMAR